MDACETVEAFVANDLRFHRLIGAASRNPVLASVLESFSTPMSRTRVWRGVTQANAIEQTKAQHAALYDALAHRRPDVARAVATAHIAGVEAWLEARSTPPSRTRSPPESSDQSASRSASSGAQYRERFRRETSDQSLDIRRPRVNSCAAGQTVRRRRDLMSGGRVPRRAGGVAGRWC